MAEDDPLRASPAPPAIRACLFDMDGLLINSEDLLTLCANEVLREYGKPDVPWSIKAQLQGRPRVEADRIFLEWAQLPCTIQEFHSKVDALHAIYFPRTQPLPGADALLRNLHQTRGTNRVRVALATSSHKGKFTLKTAHLQDFLSVFEPENTILGDDPRIPSGRGKPAPDIYLLALKSINDVLRREGTEDQIRPEECLVLEDSVPGVEAGRRAGMQVLWCPDPGLLKEYQGRENEVLLGLTGSSIREALQKGGQKDMGVKEQVDDGWGVILESLEDFPYEKYGIKL